MDPRFARSRSLCFGVLAGFVLSAARAPLGLDFASLPAASARDAALFRSSALLLVALCCGRPAGLFAERVPVALLITGAAAGFALHGLALEPWLRLESRTGLVVLIGLACLALALLALGPRSRTEDVAKPGWIERSGLFVAGLGAALGLESIARTLRLLGGGTARDDSVFGAVLLIELALAAGAFGPWLVHPARSRTALAAGLALGAAACLYSTQILHGFSDRGGLDGFLRSPPWRLDLSHWSRLSADVLLGARVFLAPAFVLGSALAAARHRTQLASVIAGAAAGIWLGPGFVAASAERAGDPAQLPALRSALATSIAGAGAILALLGAREPGRSPAAVGIAAAAVAVLSVWLLPHRPALPLSPWERHLPQASLVRDTPEGLITIEQSLFQSRVVTLDRRRLTPSAEEERADEQRFELAFSTLDAESRANGFVRVILVGQLTPARAFVLRRLGARAIDRTAAWYEIMGELEAQLFQGEPLPEGEILRPMQALARVEEGPGRFLVIAPPVPGDVPIAPRPGHLFTGSEGALVAWLDASSPIAQRDWGERVLLSSDGFEDLCVGVTFDPEAPFAAGQPLRGPMPWRWLALRPFEREQLGREAVARRLARAAEGTSEWKLLRGLELHYGTQARSSPWETPAEQTELDERALVLLRDDALELPPPLGPTPPGAPPVRTFVRALWSRIAGILVEKRDVERILSHLGPLAQRHAPWSELELALARADLELLEPESAAERLLAVLEREPYDLGARLACADALLMSERAPEAVVQLRAALSIQPGREDVERRLAMALVRAGDPAGPEQVRELLLENPDDEELRAYLGPGPLPPVEPSFTPSGERR